MRKLILLLAFLPVLAIGQTTIGPYKKMIADTLVIRKAVTDTSTLILVLDANGRIKVNRSAGGGGSTDTTEWNIATKSWTSTYYEPVITAGTTAQYWRGDKTWQTLPVAASVDSIPFQRNASRGVTFLRNGTDKVAIGSTATPDSTLKVTGGVNITRGLKVGLKSVLTGAVSVGGTTSDSTVTVTGSIRATKGIKSTYQSEFDGVTIGNGNKSSQSVCIGTAGTQNMANAQNKGDVAIGYTVFPVQINSLADASRSNNVGVGAYVGQQLTSGYYNTFVGGVSGQGVTTGTENTFIGYSTGGGGSRNTAIGAYALLGVGTGTDNIGVGDSAGRQYANISNRMYLGARDSTTTGIYFNRTTGWNKGYWNGKLNIKTVPYSASPTLKVVAQDTTTGDLYRTTVTGGTTYTATSPMSVAGNDVHILSDTLASWYGKMNHGATAYGWGNHASAGYMTNPMTTNGDLIYQHPTTPTRIPIGTLGQRLQVMPDDGNGLTIGWATPEWTSGSGKVYYTGGNVGVNTTNPSTAKLQVAGKKTVPFAVSTDNDGSLGDSTAIYVDAKGQVGIGSNATANMKLRIWGDAMVTDKIYAGSSTNAWFNGYQLSGDTYIGLKSQSGEDIRFYNTTNLLGRIPTTGGYLMNGTSARLIGIERHTTTNTAGNSLTLQAGGATSGATDKLGGPLYYYPGISTGNATGIAHQWYTGDAGSSGTTDQTMTAKMTLYSSGIFDVPKQKHSATDTTGLGSTANVGMMMYYNGHFYGLIAGTPPLWKQLDN